MTYAQAANRETCAGADCCQPTEAYTTVVGDKGVTTIGWCLDCVTKRFEAPVEAGT